LAIVDLDTHRAVVEETGEVLRKQTVYMRDNEVVRTFDPRKMAKNIKHVKLRTAANQKATLSSLGRDEKALLFTLLLYMDWETSIVVGDGNLGKKNTPLKWKEIDTVSGLGKTNRVATAKALEKKRVIGYMEVNGKRVGIVVNPEFAIYGKNPAKALLQIFNCDESVMDEEDEAQ
jgi:hypothetical protein